MFVCTRRESESGAHRRVDIDAESGCSCRYSSEQSQLNICGSDCLIDRVIEQGERWRKRLCERLECIHRGKARVYASNAHTAVAALN